MLLRMICRESDISGKKLIRIGQLLLSLGLGCNAGALLLDRFTNTGDFFQGFLTGFGLVMLGASVAFNTYGLKRKRGEA